MPSIVLLLSDKRSGSTMFQDEICRHPDVQTVPYSPHSNLETHWWLTAAVLLRRPDRLFSSGRAYGGYGSRANARAYMIDLLARCVPDFQPPADDRALVFDGWEALCQAYARPVFFEKSPQFLAHWAALSLILEWMQTTRFDVKIVAMVRNPHGTMYSAAALFGTDPGKRQYGWLEICRNLLAFEQMLPEGRLLTVRYEDLVQAPVDGFAAICRFIGIEPDPRAGSGTHAKSSEKWKQDSSYTLQLDPAVQQIARRFGYSSADLANPQPAGAGAPLKAPKRRSPRLRVNRLRDRFVQPALLRLRRALGRKPAKDESLRNPGVES